MMRSWEAAEELAVRDVRVLGVLKEGKGAGRAVVVVMVARSAMA
jgi:hypothetical protein